MQRTHRGVALDTVFDENGTRRGSTFLTGINISKEFLLAVSRYVPHTVFESQSSLCLAFCV